MTKLQLQTRELVGKKVKVERRSGQVPVVLYGPKYKSTNMWVDRKEFQRAYAKAGYSSMIDVYVGEGDHEKVLIKEIQQHPVTDEVLHVSMYVIDANSPITADIPIHYDGVSPAETLNIGFVVYSLSTVAVRCLPKDLPSELRIDISSLAETGDSILVESLQLPDGVEFDSKTDIHAALAYVAEPQKIEDVLAEIEAESGEAAEEGEDGEEGAEGEGSEEGDSEDTGNEEGGEGSKGQAD